MPSASSPRLASLSALNLTSALTPKATHASSRSHVTAAAADVAGGLPYDVISILGKNGVIISCLVSKDASTAFVQNCSTLAQFSEALHPKPGADLSNDWLAKLPNVGLLLQELRCTAKSAKSYVYVVKQFAKALASGQVLPEGWQAWLADFACGAGLLNSQTNPLFQLEDGELEQLASAFPVPEGVFNAPPHFGPFMPIPSLGIAIQLAIDKKAFLENPSNVGFVHSKRMLKYDSTVCLAAVEQSWLNLLFVLPDCISEDMCLAAVSQDGNALQHVPEGLRTEKVCLAAVNQDGRALKDVPEGLRTKEICLAAVSQNWLALDYVPEYLKIEVMYLAKMNQDRRALKDVPEGLSTEKVCLAVVNQDGRALKDVPEGLRTKEICLAAVNQNGDALNYVPESLRTKEICLAAVSQNWLALDYVPEALKADKDVCLAVVSQSGFALTDISEGLRTKEICLAAVNQNKLALAYVPEYLKIEVMYLAKMNQNGLDLEGVPESLRTKEICLAAVKQNGLALEHVPEDWKTASMCLAACKQNPDSIKFLSKAERWTLAWARCKDASRQQVKTLAQCFRPRINLH